MPEVVTEVQPQAVDPKKVKEQKRLAALRDNLDRGMRYVLDQVLHPQFDNKIRDEDRKALVRVVAFLGTNISADDKGVDSTREMQRAYQIYIEANTVHAHVRGVADVKEDSKQTVRAQLDAEVRERLSRDPDAKVTEKYIESQVYADPKYKSFLADLMSYKTLSDVTYGLREAANRHFLVLEHRSNDVRAAFKAGS